MGSSLYIYSIAIVALFAFSEAKAQKRVSFYTSDSVFITADLYESEKETGKFALLLHQAGYSRGEFKEIAPRLIKLGYTCLAIDLRVGAEANFILNETAARETTKGAEHSQYSILLDIEAGLNYIKTLHKEPGILLFGSSFSASLALLRAAGGDDINAVVAFSPGEFFQPEISLEQKLESIKIPVFIACPRGEFAFIEKLSSRIEDKYKTIFIPERGEGLHGAKTLWWESATRNEYWLALLFFLNEIK
jgi:dienelactone hydrolase